MTAEGKLGAEVVEYNWSAGWTNARAFEAGGRNYILLLKAWTGTVDINHLRSDGTIGVHVFQYGRKPDYTTEFASGSLAQWVGPLIGLMVGRRSSAMKETAKLICSV